MQSGELPDGWESAIPVFAADAKGMSGRKAGNKWYYKRNDILKFIENGHRI